MKYIIAILAIISLGGFGLYTYLNQSNGVGGGLGTIEQLSQWRNDGTYITQNTIGTILKLTGYESSGDCLVTNASGVVSTSSCSGGGSSKWTDGGSVIYPVGGESVAVSSISATGTATSTFTRLSVSTALNLFGTIGTALSDFCVAITGGAGLCDGNDATGGGGGSISTSTTPVAGQLAFWTSNSALSSVATGTLTESVSGLQFDQTRGLVGGSAVLSLTSGFAIPSTTDYTGWNLASSSRHSAVTLSGALDYITLVGQDIVRGAIDLATDITGTLLVGNGGTGLTSTSTFLFENEIDTESELETFLTDVTNVFTNNDGALADDNLTNNSIEDLNDVGAMTENTGDLLTWNGSAWTDTATSALGYSWNNLINIPAGFADNTDDTGGGSGTSTKFGSYIVAATGGDYTTIQGALDACGTAGGGSIYLTDATYNQGGTGLRFKGSGCHIYGRGSGTTTITFTGATTLFKTNSAASTYSNNGVHDVVITADGNTSGIAFDISDMVNQHYSNIIADNIGTFIRMNDTQNITFYNTFEKFYATTITAFGINGSSTNPANGNRFIDGFFGYGANVTGIQLNNTNGSLFQSIRLEPSSTVGTKGIFIWDSASTDGVFGNRFEDLYIEGNGTGIQISATAGSGGGIKRNMFNGMVEANTTDLSLGTNIARDNTFFNITDSFFGNAINSFQTFFGIGTTTPSKEFVVNGNVQFTGLASCDSIDTDANGIVTCGTDATGGGSGGGLSTTSPWTNGNLAYVTGLGTVGSVATGTLTTTATGTQFSATRGVVGGSSVFSWATGYDAVLFASTTQWSGFYNTPSSRITAGNYLSWSGNTLNASVQISTSSSNGNLAFWTGSSALGNVATGSLTEGVTGLEFTANRALVGGSAVLNLTTGYGIPLTASTTEWTNFYNTPSTRITAGANCSWAGNTFNCEGGGGGGGGALSTTTDVIGSPATPELVSYVTGDVMFGGSASTSAEFQFDDDAGQFILSSTSNANATATIESNNNAQAVRIGDDSGVGFEWIFSTASTIITKVYGAITAWIIDVAKVAVTGKLYVATTTYNGATTTDAVVIDGFTNSGEWIQEFCTTPTGETTAITADTLRGCGRYAYSEDAAGQLDFVVPTTGTSTYFNLQPGATGANNALGDGMLINWASGLDFGDIQRHQPAMEFAIRQSQMANATSTFISVGLTSAVGVNADAAAESAQGFYVFSSSTVPNYLFACNPSTGATTYVDTGIASSTTTTADANPFVHFRLEVGGTANTAVTAILKARTTTNRNMTDVASCTLDLSASTQAVAPTAGIGKATAGTSSDLHLMFLKFWYKQPVF